jgi:ABC-2 type transport system permease protein
MSGARSSPGARIFDVGYRAYDGPRNAPAWALVTVWRHTVQRVLGLHRAFRHKVLPGIALVIAFVPALIFVGIAAFLPVEQVLNEILPSYGEYIGFTTLALALFASFVAPEALCTDRRTGMLDLYLAGPLDVKRYLGAKWAAVAGVMAAMTMGPQVFLVVAYSVVSAGPSLGDAPLLLVRIVVSGIGVALFYSAVAMAVSSLTTRRAVAAVAIVLVLLVPSIAVGVAVESSGAPDELALATPAVTTEFTRRVFGEERGPLDERPPIAGVSTELVAVGLAAWVALGAAVCLVSYRRQAARR